MRKQNNSKKRLTVIGYQLSVQNAQLRVTKLEAIS
jgi:hypothetical protein